jgi:hypothetical protein
LHRSVVADVGITTPKQMARMLVKFDRRHPEIPSSQLVISQVPGSMPRSSAVHGVVESFFKSKKYFVPTAVACPMCAGGVVALYVGTGAGRFHPSRDLFVLNPEGDVEPPLGSEDRLAYQRLLRNLLTEDYPVTAGRSVEKEWSRLQARAKTGFDDQGRPILQIELEGRIVRMGVSADNILEFDAPAKLTRELLEARLQSELRPKAASKLTEHEMSRDWNLLQQALADPQSDLTARSTAHADYGLGNRR